MTRQHDFKQRVRARMEKTGERYSTARAHVLAALSTISGGNSPPQDQANATNGYPFARGVCRDTTAARNMLAALGLRDPVSRQPLSEAMLTGLCGGICFLYAVFEYPQTPPLLSVLMRYDTSADQFTIGGLRRLGSAFAITETGGAAKAQRTLDDALASRVAGGNADIANPVLCVVDATSLHATLLPNTMAGMAPTVVVVTGSNSSGYIVDGGAGAPIMMSREKLAAGRAGYKKAKHRQVAAVDLNAMIDLPQAIDGAIADTLHRYDHSPYKGFASNFGFAGMRKFAKLLTDTRDPKCWAKVFPEGALTALALRRAYQGIEYEMTGPGGGRWMYAQFLNEAATTCAHPPYAEAAKRYEQAAAHWSGIAAFIADCHIPEVKTGCSMLDSYSALLDEQADTAAGRDVSNDLQESGRGCSVGKNEAREIYTALSAKVTEAADAEQSAVDALRRARDQRS